MRWGEGQPLDITKKWEDKEGGSLEAFVKK
jgi:hypothetical protein